MQFSDDTDPHPAIRYIDFVIEAITLNFCLVCTHSVKFHSSKLPENTQQTPNPEAQLPPFVPPLVEHSSLFFKQNESIV